MQGQDPIAVLGPNALGADRIRQGKAPHEGTIGPFDSEAVFFLDVLFELSLSTDGQGIVCNADVNVPVLEIRQVGLYDQFIFGFVDVYGWCPGCRSRQKSSSKRRLT
jgi:hypothetical protein